MTILTGDLRDACARLILLLPRSLPRPLAAPARAQVRIKDIADVEGVRDNQLVGYGLVVGLNGTGDKLDNAVFTRQSLIGMLERLGVNTRDQEAKLQTKNVAAVMVTANLPAFARSGSRIDVAVSALGDATNLTGGTLLVTPLLGADGEVYGVAQGALATGAIAARGRRRRRSRAACRPRRASPTARPSSARCPSSSTERRRCGSACATPTSPPRGGSRTAINRALGGAPRARPTRARWRSTSPGATRSTRWRASRICGSSRTAPAVVVIDEASGTIVMGANVRISTVAIAQGNLTIRVTETPEVSQPGAVVQRPRPRSCRAPTSRSTTSTTASSASCAAASRCATWSPA